MSKHRPGDGRRLTGPDAAAPLDMKWLLEDGQRVGRFSPQDPFDRVAADDVIDAARLGGLETEEADVVDDRIGEVAVGVETALVAGDGEAGALGQVLAGVADIIEECPLGILHRGRAERLADEPVEGDKFVGRRARGQAFDDKKASAILEGLENGGQLFTEFGALGGNEAEIGGGGRALVAARLVQPSECSGWKREVPCARGAGGGGRPGGWSGIRSRGATSQGGILKARASLAPFTRPPPPAGPRSPAASASLRGPRVPCC